MKDAFHKVGTGTLAHMPISESLSAVQRALKAWTLRGKIAICLSCFYKLEMIIMLE